MRIDVLFFSFYFLIHICIIFSRIKIFFIGLFEIYEGLQDNSCFCWMHFWSMVPLLCVRSIPQKGQSKMKCGIVEIHHFFNYKVQIPMISKQNFLSSGTFFSVISEPSCLSENIILFSFFTISWGYLKSWIQVLHTLLLHATFHTFFLYL